MTHVENFYSLSFEAAYCPSEGNLEMVTQLGWHLNKFHRSGLLFGALLGLSQMWLVDLVFRSVDNWCSRVH